MKHQIAAGEKVTVPMLEALLLQQQADGDTEGAASTRYLMGRLIEHERLRHQALRAGRWPFVVSEPKQEDDK